MLGRGVRRGPERRLVDIKRKKRAPLCCFEKRRRAAKNKELIYGKDIVCGPGCPRRDPVKKLREQGEIRACYEAGPTGYCLSWQFTELDVECEVIAPSLIPKGKRADQDRPT